MPLQRAIQHQQTKMNLDGCLRQTQIIARGGFEWMNLMNLAIKQRVEGAGTCNRMQLFRMITIIIKTTLQYRIRESIKQWLWIESFNSRLLIHISLSASAFTSWGGGGELNMDVLKRDHLSCSTQEAPFPLPQYQQAFHFELVVTWILDNFLKTVV